MKENQINKYISHITGNIAAGVVVAILLIPQSMAYAAIAGVPIILGLFAAIFPAAVYLLLGTSKYLSIGPVSIASILAFSSISAIANPASAQYIKLIILLTLLVGVIQILLGCIRMGTFFANISPAVISGFISASALVIIFNQIGTLLGISLPPLKSTLALLSGIALHINDINVITAVLGMICLIALLIIQKKLPPAFGPLVLVTISIITTIFFRLQEKGVDIIGKTSQDLPVFSIQLPTLHILPDLLPSAFMIGFISFAESYAIASSLAKKEKQQLHANRELFSLGFANVVSSFAGAIPVAGAISRSAVNHQSGATSKLASAVTIIVMVLALLYITPLLYYLPKAALAAIVIVSVWKLIDRKAFVNYIHDDPRSAWMFAITFITTFMFDIFIGFMFGILLSYTLRGKIIRYR